MRKFRFIAFKSARKNLFLLLNELIFRVTAVTKQNFLYSLKEILTGRHNHFHLRLQKTREQFKAETKKSRELRNFFKE